VLPGFVRSALETELNNEMQPIEERLRGQLLEVIEQAQNRAFHEYRAMMDTNHRPEPSVDSGYLSNHWMPDQTRGNEGEEPSGSFPAVSSIQPEAESGDVHLSPYAFSPPFMGLDFTASLESISPIEPGFGSIRHSEDLPFQGTMPSAALFPEGPFYSHQPFFNGPPGDVTANMMDMNTLTWGFQLREDPSPDHAT
jgi:hypothetical protein